MCFLKLLLVSQWYQWFSSKFLLAKLGWCAQLQVALPAAKLFLCPDVSRCVQDASRSAANTATQETMWIRILPLGGLEHELQNLRSSGVLCAPCGYCTCTNIYWIYCSACSALMDLTGSRLHAGPLASSGTSVFPVSSYLCLRATSVDVHVEGPVWENLLSPSRCENPTTVRESKETNRIFD